MSTEPLSTRILLQQAVLIIYIPLIAVTNIVVIAAIVLFRQLHTPENYILVNLASADLITGLLTIPIYILYYNPATMHLIRAGRTPCFLSTMVKALSTQSSLCFLAFLCLDRFIAINWPLRYRKVMTTRLVLVTTVVIWLFQLAQCSSLGVIMSFNETTLPLEARCSFYVNVPLWYRKYYTAVQVDAILLVCFVLCLEKIVKVAKTARQLKRRPLDRGDEEDRRVFRSSAAGVRLSSMMTFLFIVLWFPSIFNTPLQAVGRIITSGGLKNFRTVSRVMRLTVALINAPVFAFSKNVNRVAYLLVLTTVPWRWSELRSTLIETIPDYVLRTSRQAEKRFSLRSSLTKRYSTRSPGLGGVGAGYRPAQIDTTGPSFAPVTFKVGREDSATTDQWRGQDEAWA